MLAQFLKYPNFSPKKQSTRMKILRERFVFMKYTDKGLSLSDIASLEQRPST